MLFYFDGRRSVQNYSRFLVDGNRIPFDLSNVESLDALLYVVEQNEAQATGTNTEIPIHASGLG